MSQQPHILMITCDHLRADMMGCAGHPIIQTPHMDQLAQRGVRFTQAYSTTPICIPARGMIMTGRDGHHLGLTVYRAGFELPTRQTLPQQLRDAGYQTKVVGKMHVYPERCHYGFETMLLCEEGRLFGAPYKENRGYDDYEQWLAEQGYPGQAFGHGLSINEYTMTPWHLPDHLHPTEWIGHTACKEIKRRDWTRPLFMWVSFTAPHPPLTPLLRDLHLYDRDEMPAPVRSEWDETHSVFHDTALARYADMNTKKKHDLAIRAYYAAVTQIDRQINRLIGTLQEQGMLEKTWIILTSDHGDNLGNHRLWQKGNFLKGATNIPLIIVPPLKDPAARELLGDDWLPGAENHSVVGLQDLLPTLAELGQAEIPENIQGRSLLPLVKDCARSVREVILGEFGLEGQRSFMVTDGRWKYIWYEEDGIELLFHIAEDPDETRDLSKEPSAPLVKYRSRLAELLSERENDPAVRDGRLVPSNPNGRRLTHAERIKRMDSVFLHRGPVGLH